MISVGIDANSHSIAYSVIEDDKLTDYGLIELPGERYEKIQNAYLQSRKIFNQYDPDLVIIEDAVFVNNQAVLISLAMIFGSVTAAADCPVKFIRPLEWQSAIGNKVLNKIDKDTIKAKTPGKSEAWYKNQYRLHRKDFTRQWVNKTYGVLIDSDDITDSIAINFSGVK